MISPEHDEKALKPILRELQALKHLKHKNVSCVCPGWALKYQQILGLEKVLFDYDVLFKTVYIVTPFMRMSLREAMPFFVNGELVS